MILDSIWRSTVKSDRLSKVTLTSPHFLTPSFPDGNNESKIVPFSDNKTSFDKKLRNLGTGQY